MPDFPANVPVKQLLHCLPGSPLNCHSQYRPDKYQMYSDFYVGGEQFAQRKNSYLYPKDIEKEAPKIRTKRLVAAAYTAHVSGILDFIIAAIFRDPPRIEADGPAKDYYEGLNDNVDGTGRDLETLARTALLSTMLNGRCYFSIDFPPQPDELPSRAAQEEQGLLDASICLVRAQELDNWESDAKGGLNWVRTHVVDIPRPMVGPPTFEVHHWTYILPDMVMEYQASREIKNGSPLPWGSDAVAIGVQTGPILPTLELPVVPVMILDGLWVMARLEEAVLALWNAEAGLSYYLLLSCFPMLMVSSNKELKSILQAAEFALDVGPNGSAQYIGPNAQLFDALHKDIDRKKSDLMSSLQAMALQIPTRDPMGRMTGVAKSIEVSMLETLLDAFGNTLRHSLNETVQRIRRARGDEDTSVKVVGFTDFSLVERVKDLPISSKSNSEELAAPDSAQTTSEVDDG